MVKKFLKNIVCLLCGLMVVAASMIFSSAVSNPYPSSQTIGGVTTIPCTYYAWQQAYEKTGVAMPNFGNAKNWYSGAQSAGYAVGSVAKPKSIAVWSGGTYGHVSYVVSVNGNKMTVNEGGMYNSNGGAYNGNGILNGNVVNSVVGQAKGNGSDKILVGFIYLTETPSQTVSIKNDTSKNTITDTNAILWGWVDKPSSYSVTKIGVRIRRYDSDYANGRSKFEVPSKNYVGSTYMQPYYNINSELNLKLRHATKYFYQIYAVVNGKECWSAETSFTTTGSHTYSSNWTTTKAATCTEDGSAKRQCTSCVVTETKVLTKLGHNYSNNYTVDKAPTCTTSGSKSRHCTRCSSKSNITEIVPTGHSFSSWQITVQPTCVKEGSQTRKCSVCSHVENKVVSPKGHSYSSEWTIDNQPSCVGTGMKSKHCKSCDSIKEIQSISPTGHNWSDFTVVTEATIEKEGKSVRKCINSNCKSEETKVLPKLAKDGHTHNFEEWEIAESATCQNEGVKQRRCVLCNEKETLTISATGHSFDEWIEKDGIATRKCKACGTIEEEITEKIDNTNEDVNAQLTDNYKAVDNNLMIIYIVSAALILSIVGFVVYVFVIRKNKLCKKG